MRWQGTGMGAGWMGDLIGVGIDSGVGWEWDGGLNDLLWSIEKVGKA